MDQDHFQHQHASHHHHHAHGKTLVMVILLNIGITLVQIIGGIISNSLSLLSDALHNLGDSSALFIAYIAHKISHKKPNVRKTFGYKRVEILAALFNGTVLIAICLFLFYEAFHRFLNPEPVKGWIMLVIATVGLLANGASIVLLQRGKKESLNLRAAYLHLLGDTLSSIAVLIGGLLIWLAEIYWIDPVVTFLVGAYILYNSWNIIRETVDILMQASPEQLDILQIKTHLEQLGEIDNVHHIHLWRLNDVQIHFEAHINLKNNIQVQAMMEIRHTIEQLLKDRFCITHTTLQFGYNCCSGNAYLIEEL